MKPRPDSRSRYWLDFREFHYEGEDMVVGRAHEINPNTPKGIARRLLDLVRRTRLAGDGENVKDGDGDGGNGGDGDERDGGEAAADGNDKTEKLEMTLARRNDPHHAGRNPRGSERVRERSEGSGWLG